MKNSFLFPRRILMTADAVGGVWTYALELARGLTARGAEVIIATMGPRPRAEQRVEAAGIAGLSLVESDFALEWMRDPWVSVDQAGEWLLDLERKLRPDLVHLNGYVHAALDWSTPAVVVAHSCVLSWWRAVKGQEAPAEWNEYRDRVRNGLQDADLVIAPTAWLLRELERIYGPLGDPRVISNGRSIRPANTSGKERFVLSVGRLWDDAKNMRALADVARELDWPVYVAGDPRAPDGSMQTFPNVKLFGLQSSLDVLQLAQRASIFAEPARYEPFGLSALEAAMSGCALVLGDIPSLREVWADAALYVHPDNRGGLRSTIQMLIEHPGHLAHMAQAARLRARRYTMEAMTQGYIEAYEALLTGGRASLAETGIYS